MTSYEIPIIKAAVTLATANTILPRSAVISAIGLYNADVSDIVVTPKDGNGKILGITTVPAGETQWIDFANIVKGKGFYFDRGVYLGAGTGGKVDAWLAGYEDANLVPPFESEILKAALTLGLSNVMVSRDALISGIGLYNSHSGIVTVTPKDASGKILSATPIPAGATAYLDWANISRGRGFFFDGGLTLAADVAGKVDAWVAGFTQV